MHADETRRRVCAVILTYHPRNPQLATLVGRIAPQVDAIVLVDNGSTAASRELIREATRSFSGTVVVPLDDNLGVAAGHNVGIGIALERGFEFVLILDQDSVPAPDMVARLMKGYADAAGRGRPVAAVGPRYVHRQSGRDSFFVQFGLLRFRKVWCSGSPDALVPADMLISSGSLIPAEALRAVGMMRDDLFIDHVDTEWFLRAAQHGRASYGVCDALMEHEIGERRRALWIGGRREFSFHSPLRHYYTFRNSVFLYTRTRYPMRWKMGRQAAFRHVRSLRHTVLGSHHACPHDAARCLGRSVRPPGHFRSIAPPCRPALTPSRPGWCPSPS